MSNVKSVFEKHLPNLIFDKKLMLKVQTYEQRFVNKNEAHIAFFGGNLMGVDPVRFRDEDRNTWFNEILDADEDAIEDDLHALPVILPHRHVSSDVMNLSCLWMAHRFLTSDKLNEADRQHAALTVILVLQYKFITSILADWFTWSADPVVAQATYTALNKRFGLKVAGSWGVLLRSRAQEVVGVGKLHYKRFLDFNNDDDIVYMANDTQGRIKDILKNIRDMFTIVSKSPELLIRNSASMIELDGELKLRDKTRLIGGYLDYILTVVSDKNGFIVGELVDVAVKTVNTIPKRTLVDTLTYMSNNASPKVDKRVTRVCELTIQHAFDYLAKNPTAMASQRDIPGLLRKMKALYQASRTNNPMIVEMRELTEGMVKVATGSKNTNLIAAVRNAVLLYILLRTWTKDHFRK